MDPKTTGFDGSKKQTPASPVHKGKGKVIPHPLHVVLCPFHSCYMQGKKRTDGMLASIFS